MRAVVVQPCYLPWRGHFHLIEKCDIFVFYDDVQHTVRDWRTRNRIKTAHGSHWITVPVLSKHRRSQRIMDVEIDNSQPWRHDHWKTIRLAYSKAPYFSKYAEILESTYAREWTSLCELDIHLTIELCRALGIQRNFVRSSQTKTEGVKTERLVNICKAVGADHYISGPTAKAYLDETLLQEAGITTEYMVYNYPPYPQLYGNFDPFVSVIDLLFNCGPASPDYIWGQYCINNVALKSKTG